MLYYLSSIKIRFQPLPLLKAFGRSRELSLTPSPGSEALGAPAGSAVAPQMVDDSKRWERPNLICHTL